jgi:hypothetical protein
MDAAMLILVLVVAGVAEFAKRNWRVVWPRKLVAYLVGAAAMAAALTLAFTSPTAEPRATVSPRLSATTVSPAAGLSGSRRLAPPAVKVPIQCSLAIEPFEVRNEVLVSVIDVASELEIEDDYIEIDEQIDVARRICDLVASRTSVVIDDEQTEGFVDRVSFMTADATGVLPRQTPVRELLDEALVGVTLAYLTSGMPDDVQLIWERFSPELPEISITVIDPETSVSAVLTPNHPVVRWRNELLENPVPEIVGVAVEPVRFPLPILSLVLLFTAFVLFINGVRGRRNITSFAGIRVLVALALVVGPLTQIAVALPASFNRSTSPGQAQRILASVLPNVYRAFELRDEAAAYDRLAVAVTGETLEEIYLEHRRSLEMEERGGARARVDAVEVLDVTDIKAREDGGFNADASWTVGGTVTHFGHRHFRQNRYDCRVAVVPDNGIWKIRTIEVREQERIR